MRKWSTDYPIMKNDCYSQHQSGLSGPILIRLANLCSVLCVEGVEGSGVSLQYLNRLDSQHICVIFNSSEIMFLPPEARCGHLMQTTGERHTSPSPSKSLHCFAEPYCKHLQIQPKDSELNRAVSDTVYYDVFYSV